MTSTRREFIRGLVGTSAAVVVGVRALTCPNCGAPLRPGSKECHYCGSYFYKEVVPIEDIPIDDLSEPLITTYVALICGDGEEPSDPAYERQPVEWSSPEKGEMQNTNEITFNVATRDWPVVTGLDIVDESGEALFCSRLDLSKKLWTGDIAKFDPGSIRIEV